MYHHGYFFGPGGELYMMLIPLLIIVILVYLGVKVLQKSKPGITAPTNQGLQILNERFAKGEIEEAEYLQKKALLMNQ